MMKKRLLIWCAAVIAATMSLNAGTPVLVEGFEEGFETNGWTQDRVLGEMDWRIESESDNLAYPATVHEGTHRAYLRNPGSETLGYKTRLVSKVMDLNPLLVYQPELSFWYANPKWGADRDTLRVLYRTNTRGAWKELAVYASTVSDWTHVKMKLPEVGPVYQIAFEGTDNLGHGIVLDEVMVRPEPECTIPDEIMATNKGAGKVNVSWQASWDADNWELIVSRDTIDPDMINEIEETTPEKIAYHGIVDEQNKDLTLESGEYYLVYVRSLCEEENSAWSSEASKDGPFGFRVRVAKQVPFTEKFNYAKGVTRDEDWTWDNNLKNIVTPYVNSSASGNARVNYSPDTTAAVIFSGAFGSPSTFIPADRYVYVATPALADTTNDEFAINQCQVHFWSTVYTYTGRQYGRSILVGIMEDPEDITTFRAVDTVSVWGNKTFQENIVDLSSYDGNGTFLAFVSDFDRENLFYIDNVTVEYIPDVNKVTKISVNPRDTFATISWEGNADSYNVLITNAEVNPANPTADAVVDQATVTGNSYLCEALEADHSWNRPYYVYVQAEGQDWSYRYPFVTIAAQREIPYIYDFEARTTTTYKIGTAQYVAGLGIFGNAGSYPAVTVGSSYSGSNCLFMSKRGGTDAWITLPMVENLNGTQVKFYLNCGSNSYTQSHATIGIMTNPMDINTFIPVSSFKLNTTGYVRCYTNFENYSGPEGVIAIVWDDVFNMTANTINYIDEIIVEELSECVPPTNITVAVEPDSVTVGWEASSLSDEWEFFLSRTPLSEAQRIHKTLDEIAAMGGVVVAQQLYWNNPNNSPQFGFGNLVPHSNYYMYVRATCDLEWWSEMAFSTPCRDEEYPYKETFEDFNVGSQAVGCYQLADYMGVNYPCIYQAGTSSASNKTLELYSSGTIHRSIAILPTIDGNLSDMLFTFDVRTKEGTASSKGVVIVGTMADILNQNSFVPFDTVYVSGTAFQKARFILSNYELEYDNIAITSGLGTNLMMNSDILIDNVELKDPSCIDAYDIKQVNPGPHDIDLEWKGASNNDQWEIKMLSKEVSIASIKNNNYNHSYDIIADTLVTGKTFHVGDLATQKTYYFYIRTLCGDSAWAAVSAYTTCELLDPTKANKETFESYAEGATPGCWTVGTRTGTGTLPYVHAINSQNALYIYQSSTSAPAWAASPEIKCNSLTSIIVTFSMSAYSGEVCVWGVMTDPTDLSTFVPLDSMAGTGTSTFYQKTVDLSDYASIIPANAKHVAWRARYNKSDWVYIDDISFISNACPLPHSSISDLTTSSVRVNGGLSTSDDWVLLITNHVLTDPQLDGTAAIPDSWIVTRDTTDKSSIKVNDLQGQSKYYVHTATLCGDSAMSQWKSFYFVAPCEAMTPEALDVVTFDEEDGFTVGAGGDMPCWITGSKTEDVSNTYIPYIEATSSTMHNGKNYLKINDNVTASVSAVGAYAIMPELDVDSIDKYQVNFWGRANNSSSNTAQLIVGVITDPTDLSTFVPMDTLNVSKTAWDPFSVGFENYWGDYMGDYGKNIMFLSDFGATNQVYISEISVELIPHCRPISSFEVDSVGEDAAVVSWKGYQDTYRMLLSNRALEESEKQHYQYLLDTIVNHSDEVLITGLEAAATYYVYAQGICDGGDSTAISMTYATVRTTCPTVGGAALPFYDDFESYETGDAQPGCWQLLGYSGLKIGTISSNGSKGINLWSNGYMVVPRVSGELENLKLSFDARAYSTSSATKFYVGVMGDVNDVTTFQLLETFDLPAGTAFKQCQMELGDYELPYDNLVLTAGITGVTPSKYDDWVDNVGLELVATCNPPKLKSIGASYNSVEIGITPASKIDSRWEIAVIPDSVYNLISNITEYLKQVDKIVLDTTYFEISDLQSATSYQIFARTLCDDEDISNWTRNPLKVSTRYYYADSYFFGFEKKTEMWDRSTYSESDAYYIHPALVTGRDSLGAESQSYMHYPHSQENTTDYTYSRTADGAMLLYAKDGYYGSYVIFPSLGEPQARSFEFKVRPGYVNKATDRLTASTEGLLEIGLVDKDRDFSTYQSLASLQIAMPDVTVQPRSKNNYHFKNYTLDLDSATIANKQLVLHMPKQPSDSVYLFVDDASMNATKGFSLVAFKKIVADGSGALVEWQNIGGPWTLTIETPEGDVLQQFSIPSGVTSQLVEDLEAQTNYVARLVAVNVPSSAKNYVTTDSRTFRTLCRAQEADENGAFVWNFNNAYGWEANDVLAGDIYDSLYLKPNCFQTGVTYDKPVNGYQWLIQRKGYEYYGPMTGYNSSRHYESGRDDSPALRVHTTGANYNSYIVLPELNCSFDTMMIEFYGRCFVNYDSEFGTPANRGKIVDATFLGSAYSQSIVVGALTDPKDLSTLQIIDTLTYSHTDLTINDNVNNDPTGLGYWDLMQLPLAGTQGKFIVLFQPSAGLFYLDDLSIKPVGNTLFKPGHTQTTDVAATSANLSWTVWHPELASVVVLLDVTGEEIFRDSIIGTQYQLTNLQAASMYDWYVYQTDGTTNSQATKPLRFYTDCVVNSPEFTCGFEDVEGWQNIAGQTAYKQTLCWTYNDAAQGEWKSATYDPYNQANTANYKYSYEGQNAVMMRGSFSSRLSYQPYIALPAMDVTAYDTLQVMFWMRPAVISATNDSVVQTYTGSAYSKSIIVGTMTDPNNAATFVAIDTVTYDGTLSVADKATEANDWLFQQMNVELTGATGPYVALMTSTQAKGSKTQATGDYLWIDNVSFGRINECKEPKDLTVLQLGATHVVLNWNGPESAGSYLLQVSTDPFFANEDAFVFNDVVESNTYRVEHLASLTNYVWRVQSICDERWGESTFSQKATFKTSRTPYFYEPFTTTVSSTEWTFSKAHADNVLDTTGVIARGTDNWSFARTTVSYGLEGPHYCAPGYSNDYHWMITPNFYLPEDDSVHFSMDVALTACNTAHLTTGNAVTENDMMNDYYFMIIISDDGGQSWKSENILGKWQNTNPEGQQLRDIPVDGMKVRYSLAEYAGKNVRIGLYREARSASPTGIAIHVDNVRFAYFKKNVDYASACEYEDIQVGDIHLSGDETTPGIHAYPTCYYVSDLEAKAGKKDSVQQLEIEIYPAMETLLADTICEGESYTGYDFLPKDRTGVYHRKLQTIEHGCDSIVTLNLYVKERRYAEDMEVSICAGEPYEWNGKVYNRAGIYYDTIVSSIGCDSVLTLILTNAEGSRDTIRANSTINVTDLPFTYEDPAHPYVDGETPIYYAEGTKPGTYTDVKYVQGGECASVLIHTLTILDRKEGLDYVDDPQSGAHKVLYRDQMYIILNDEWYTPTGQKVADPRQ